MLDAQAPTGHCLCICIHIAVIYNLSMVIESTLFPVWDRGIETVSKREISTALSTRQTKALSACQHLAIRKIPKKKIRKIAVFSHHSNQE
ncbi:uncharacterized protein Bfra_005105 [Botrytis fragariae]|uniref:Uncharacterized protein n=1 Tax=Botrytis fragariae TaxID=1964551 RepID=A0A8H6ATU1_9HELO|nr:uncharacterized protein Bfra_005105 [Botrytis fragariae]KAF5873641.1 hypothetical protein Bfra_005105 [Botrytis fragariae]